MRFNILADIAAESKVDQVLHELSSAGYWDLFAGKNYGRGMHGVSVFLMCQDSTLNLKRRVRFSKKEKKLYMDIMLDLGEMKSASPEERRRIIVQRLAREVPETVSKYKIPDFNKEQFINDLRAWLDLIG